MTTFNLYSTDGKKVGTVDAPALFATPVIPSLIHRYFLWVRGMMRNTLAHTKTRGEVSGGGKKPWKQKGTGRARSGSIRNPIWRHGGTIFGPRKEQTYTIRMNRSERRKAMFSALASIAEKDGIIVIDKMDAGTPKTKEFIAMLGKLPVAEGQKVLQLQPEYDLANFKAGSNVPNVTVRTISHMNIIDLLNNDVVLLTKDTLEKLEQHFMPNV